MPRSISLAAGLFLLAVTFAPSLPADCGLQPPAITNIQITPDANPLTGSIDVSYAFGPNITSFTGREVWVRLESDATYGPVAVSPGAGTTSFRYNVFCLGSVESDGVATFHVHARTGDSSFPNCESETVRSHGTSLTKSVPFKVPGADIKMALRRRPNGQIEATINYTVPPSSGSWNLKVDSLGRYDEGGVFRSPATILDTTVTESGSRVEVFTPPSGARQMFLGASLSSCHGRHEDFSAIECLVCSEAPSGTKNPVAFVDADMRFSDSDPLPSQWNGAGLSRTYDSHHQVTGFFGRGWMSMFDRRLDVTSRPGLVDVVSLTSETNDAVIFAAGLLGGYEQRWPKGRRASGTLLENTSEGVYIYREPGASTESLFRISDGRFAGLRQIATGRRMDIAYDANGYPTTVSDSWTGLTWTITVDSTDRRITSITLADAPAITWTFQYSGGNLVTVLAPASATWRTYEYQNNRMTASRDAAGNLIESHDYDSNGSAISSTGPDDEVQLVEYDLSIPGRTGPVTRVTTRSGAVAEYVLAPVGGAWRTVQVIGGCASCGGRNSTYVYDNDGHLIRQQQANGYVTVNTYADGRLASVQTPLKRAGCDPETDANRCRVDNIALAAATLETTPEATLTTYTYADTNWPDRPTETATTSVMTPSGARRERMTYDAMSGQVVQHQIIGWTGAPAVEQTRTTTTALYGANQSAAFAPGGTFDSAWLSLAQPAGSVKSLDGPRTDAADITKYVYYPIDASVPAVQRGRLAAIRDAAGHITRFESYDVFENVTRSVDANGVVTEKTFDGLGRTLTTTIKGVTGCDATADPLCNTDLTSTRTYAAAGPLDREQRPGGGVTKYTYDARGRIETISRGPSATDLREKLAYTYDASSGRKSLEVTLAKEAASWVEKRRESYTYDSLDQLSSTIHADNTSIAYTYRDDGLLVGVRDENHTTPNTTYDYDASGRMKKVTQKLGTGSVATQYSYDRHGNLTSVTDPNGNVTTYTYDDFGQMLAQTSPVTGVTTYEYDLAGELTRTVDANGAATVRIYDVLGRVVSALSSAPDSMDEGVLWSYDDGAAGSYAVGRLSYMEDPAGSTTYAYDRRGFLIREDRTSFDMPSGELCISCIREFVTRYQYDANANRSSSIYPSGRIINYTYDFADRPTTVAEGASPLISSTAYLPFGPLMTISFANGTTQTWTFDTRYRPVTNQLTKGAATLASYSYGYDPVGNITAIQDLQDAAFSRTFGYDDLNRLVTANTSASLWGTGSFVYDAMGNMLSRMGGSSVTTFTYQGTTPKLTSSSTTGQTTALVTYDPAGNEVEVDSQSLRTFSARNLMSKRLGAATEESNGYDGRGVRVRSATQKLSGASFVETEYQYTPELNLLSTASEDGAGDRVREIVWFAGRPVAQFDTDAQSSTLRYTVTDHLGTPFLQTDATGQTVWRAEYDPYGAIARMRTGSAATQPLRFPGQEASPDGGESYNIFRWYRADWGRYTQADPLELDGGLNLYVYADDSPLQWFDPLGLSKRKKPTAMDCCELWDAMGREQQELDEKIREYKNFRKAVRRGTKTRTYAQLLVDYVRHLSEYEQRQANLQKLIDEYDDRCGPPNKPVPQEARERVTRKYPGTEWIWEMYGQQLKDPENFENFLRDLSKALLGVAATRFGGEITVPAW